MYELSIIVPLLGELTKFEDTLASVLRHRPKNAQVIVPHDGQYHDPHDLRNDVEFVVCQKRKNLAGFLNASFNAVQGSVTVCIRPGVEIDEDWEHSVIDAFHNDRVGAVTPVIYSETTPSRIVAAGVTFDWTLTRQLAGRGGSTRNASPANIRQSGPTSWLAAWRTRVLQSLAPLDERLDSVYIDLDIALSIAGLGFIAVLEPDFVGLVESENEIIVDSATPHWASAQRAQTRHRQLLTHSLPEISLMETGQIPSSEVKLKHILQRLHVWRMRKSDEQFRTRLQLNRAVAPVASSPSGFESTHASHRRAA